LDGLRFIAVFSVLLYHYSEWIKDQLIPSIGTFIAFFFVLSSYLITTILLTKKDQDDNRVRVACNFLVRRTLRIFPAYYFYLLILLLLPFAGHDVREHPFLYFSYLSNFHTYFIQSWDPLTSHLWTLAVEEQFYVVWLVVILAVPNRYLVKVFYAIIASGVIFRLAYYYLHPQSATELIPMVILTPSCIDSFACGALLAWLHRRNKSCTPVLKKVFFATLPVWILLIRLHIWLFLAGFDRLFAQIGSMLLIEGASRGYTNMFGNFLQNKVVTYLGKISYGIYLYHLLLPFAFWKLYNSFTFWLLHTRHVDWMGLTIFLVHPVTAFFLYSLMTIGFASLSWYLLERPISRLKRFFNYAPSSKEPAPAPAG
jgi:peptidoglycan/LPS O-acetylase OafA/YrhL